MHRSLILVCTIEASEPDGDGGKLLPRCCVARAKVLIEQLAAGGLAGLGGGDASGTPEPAVLGPRSRRDPAETRPAGAEAHHPVGGAQPRGGPAGLMMNEAGHLLLH